MQVVKKKVSATDDAKGRFSQKAADYVRTVDREKKKALRS